MRLRPPGDACQKQTAVGSHGPATHRLNSVESLRLSYVASSRVDARTNDPSAPAIINRAAIGPPARIGSAGIRNLLSSGAAVCWIRREVYLFSPRLVRHV